MPNLPYEQARSLYDKGLRWPCDYHYYALPDRPDTYAIGERIQAVNVGRYLVGDALVSVSAPDLEELLAVLDECVQQVLLGSVSLFTDDCTPGYGVRFAYVRSMLSLNEPLYIVANAPRAIDAVFQVLEQLISGAVIDVARLNQALAWLSEKPADPAQAPAPDHAAD